MYVGGKKKAFSPLRSCTVNSDSLTMILSGLVGLFQNRLSHEPWDFPAVGRLWPVAALFLPTCSNPFSCLVYCYQLLSCVMSSSVHTQTFFTAPTGKRRSALPPAPQSVENSIQAHPRCCIQQHCQTDSTFVTFFFLLLLLFL